MLREFCHRRRRLFCVLFVVGVKFFFSSALILKFYISNRRKFSKLFVLLTEITHRVLKYTPHPLPSHTQTLTQVLCAFVTCRHTTCTPSKIIKTLLLVLTTRNIWLQFSFLTVGSRSSTWSGCQALEDVPLLALGAGADQDRC